MPCARKYLLFFRTYTCAHIAYKNSLNWDFHVNLDHFHLFRVEIFLWILFSTVTFFNVNTTLENVNLHNHSIFPWSYIKCIVHSISIDYITWLFSCLLNDFVQLSESNFNNWIRLWTFARKTFNLLSQNVPINDTLLIDISTDERCLYFIFF